mmetsp:Transcript_43729/g.74371  ORF Transcript_43729/g.74371 Transcript_43729/m.74371 type:complete len:80 (+) Transcript_43729:380-619(+)
MSKAVVVVVDIPVMSGGGGIVVVVVVVVIIVLDAINHAKSCRSTHSEKFACHTSEYTTTPSPPLSPPLSWSWSSSASLL